MSRQIKAQFQAALFLTLSLLLTAAIYFPGLNGPFAFDDYNNIVDNKSLRLDAGFGDDLRQIVLGGTAGPLKRPLSMLSFAANRAATGIEPFWFKLTNLSIHLFNGWLVYLLIRRLLSLRATMSGTETRNTGLLASAAAALWLVHPAQLTTVLYVVQRMTSLSATFLLAGLVTYLIARERMLLRRSARLLLWVAVPFLGGMSCLAKENGALIFLFAFVIEFCLLQFRTPDAAGKRLLHAYFLVFVGVPTIAAIAFFALHPSWLTAPNLSRPFTVVERLMTEARVLFLYLKILLMPTAESLALYYDDFEISRGLLAPATTLLSILGILGGMTLAFLFRQRFPWWSFAVLWYLAGHVIESTVIMLELVHVHRNYVPYLGPILMIVVAVPRACSDGIARILGPLAISAVMVLALVTAQRAWQWSHPLDQAAFEVHHRPNSPRANYEMGRLYYIAAKDQGSESLREEADRYFRTAMALDARAINAPVALIISNGAARIGESKSIFRELTQRLEAHPLAPTDIHFIRSLIDCQKFTNCKLPPENLLSIFGSALGRNDLRKDVRADLLTILGMYYANYAGDVSACIRTMSDAVELVPDDPNYRLNLVSAYLAASQIIEARQALHEAEQRDALGIYAPRIRELRQKIEKLNGPGQES